MAKISIIVPIYNSEKYLKRCLDSIINQTLEDIEIILVNDNSSDRSLDIMRYYQASNLKNIKIISNKENLGAGASRNKGIEESTSKYIGFVDSDDYLDLDMYEKLYHAATTFSVDIARCNKMIKYHGLNITNLRRKGNTDKTEIIIPKDNPKYLIKEYPCVMNKLFNRDLIGDRRFTEELKWEDFPFTIPLLYHANAVITVPDTNYYYRLNPNGVTMTDIKKFNPNVLDIFTCSEIIKDDISKSGADKKYLEELDLLLIQNCLQRARDVLYSNAPYKKKKELISLISSLIDKEYGSWRQNDKFKELRKKRLYYDARLKVIETLFINDDYTSWPSEDIKEKLKIIQKNKTL